MKIDRNIPIQKNQTPGLTPEVDKQLHEAAKMYEQQFLREMTKAMRQTVHESELTQSSFGQKIWKEQLDNKYVEAWSQKGGVGLADIIYEQVKQRYFPTANPGPVKPLIPVSDQWKGMPLKEEPKRPIGIEFKGPVGLQERKIQAPWPGIVENSFTDDQGVSVVNLRHSNELVSRMVFNGNRNQLVAGQQIEAGQTLGEARSSAPWLQWQLIGS